MRARFDFRPGEQPPLEFDTPDRVVVAKTVGDVPAAMAAVDQALRDGFHVAGYVAYEAAAAFDEALTTQSPGVMPLVCFGLYRTVGHAAPLAVDAVPDARRWAPGIGTHDHAAGVAAVREAIASGETYQINYTFRLRADADGMSPASWYAHLARAERAPYAAFLDTDDWQLLSLSPELFFEVDAGRVTTKPMKGTAPRGRWTEEDEALRDRLADSDKNRAENVMIVDLCRNDLSRVCSVGSVHASSLFDVERYPTVWQMVSTVEGDLQPDTTLSDLFRALFPAGSITGAPKSSSTRLIAGLEHAPRGVYCGAIGYASPDGRAMFNVAIRTMTIHTPTGRAEYGVGGGITWDSVASDEHAEAMSKAACLEPRPPFGLIETLRYEDGAYVRLDRHLARLEASAAYFDFTCDLARVRATLESHAQHAGPEAQRVRLVMNRDGYSVVQSEPLPATPDAPVCIALAATPVDSRNRFPFHKTTRREVYDRFAATHPDAFDVLLWNERRELTEFTRGNLVVELDGHLWTPHRASGLLNGVFRQVLLDEGRVRERVLLVPDLARCTRLWFVNSLREWVPVSATAAVR